MESLYSLQGNQNILDRIEQLTPITLSQWGKMTVSQMLLHCQMPLKVANGTLHIKPHWKSYFFGSSRRKKLEDPKFFHKDQTTIKEFIITHEPNYNEAKNGLKELIGTFAKEGHKVIKVTRHPLLGEMSPEEWDILQWKHLDYHLKQFGV